MKVVSLFAGCGGLDLGFERAGFEVIWANEFDASIHETYRINHPQTQLNTSDIRMLDASDVPDCDGIIGGPPCQSWSEGGKSLGIDDERGRLVFDYIRIVNAKKPKFFIMENVPGMVSAKHVKAFQRFLALFEDAGYHVKYELMNAAHFAVPQDRLRVIIVGIRKDLAVEYLFPSPVSTTPITLRQAIGDLPPTPKPYNREELVGSDAHSLNHDYYTGPFDKKFMARNRVRTWDETSFTIQAQAKNEPLHPQAPRMIYVSQNLRKFEEGKEYLYRRLSVRECARIQSFPDRFSFVYTDIADGYKMVGNAVPPRLAFYLAKSIKDCFAVTTSSNQEQDLLLVGYVKSDKDFDIINREKVYYIRRDNRPGSMQYGQILKPIKWLLAHHQQKLVLYELALVSPQECNREFLASIGFSPRGNDYWLFTIQHEVGDDGFIMSIRNQIHDLKKYPQIISITSIK